MLSSVMIALKMYEAIKVLCKSLFTNIREYSYYPIVIFKMGEGLPTSWA